MTLERRQDESELEFHKRIVYGKLVDKTLADVDYTELAEVIYGQPYSSDVARRMMYGSKRTLDIVDNEILSSIDDGGVMSEIASAKADLQKERQRFFDQRREYNKLVNSDGRLEHIYDRLEQAAKELNRTVGSIFNNTNRHEPIQTGNDEAVLVFSDWHYGMTVNNMFNEYNTQICRNRVRTTVNKTIDKIQLHKCRKLHVIVLGDMIHGAIHTSARVASEELVCDQLMQSSEILASAIYELSKYVPEVSVYVTYGNHARTVQNKNDNIHRDNMERIIPWWLTQRFADTDNITVESDSDNEFIVADVCGHTICATHGDLDGVKSSPKTLSVLLRRACGCDVEYIILGDKHHSESFEEMGVTSTICGSLCGSDDYANDKRLYSSPSQLLLIVNSADGVDAEYKLKC